MVGGLEQDVHILLSGGVVTRLHFFIRRRNRNLSREVNTLHAEQWV